MSVAFLPPPSPVRPSVRALQDAVSAVLADLPDDPRAGAEISALLTVRGQLEAALAGRLGDLERSGQWAADGSVSQAAWLRRTGNLSRPDAARALTLARRLPGVPLVAAALAAGQISAEHAGVLSHALAQLDADLRQLQEPVFLLAATLTDPLTLAAELRNRLSALLPLPAQRDADHQRAQRKVSLTKTVHGMWHLTGLLDPENGELLHTALSAQRRTDHSDGDTRTPSQRDADALAHLARLALDRAELPATHRVRPHLLITTTLEQWTNRPGAHPTSTSSPTPGSPGGPGSPTPGSPTPGSPTPGTPGTPTPGTPGSPTLASGEPLTPAALARLSCDAQLTRLVLNPAGLPLDVGRTQRTVPAQIWLAALARDRGCIIDGCQQPPDRCEAHHTQPYSQGGHTSLANTALVCVGSNGHHHQLHDQGRTLRTKSGRLLGPHGYRDITRT